MGMEGSTALMKTKAGRFSPSASWGAGSEPPVLLVAVAAGRVFLPQLLLVKTLSILQGGRKDVAL